MSFLLRRTPEAPTDTENSRCQALFLLRRRAFVPLTLVGLTGEKETVSSSSAEQPVFVPQPWGETSAGFLRDSFSPLTQGFDAYVLKVAATATQPWWQMADLQASAGQTGVHFPTFFCLSVLEEDSTVQKSFFWYEKEWEGVEDQKTHGGSGEKGWWL